MRSRVGTVVRSCVWAGLVAGSAVLLGGCCTANLTLRNCPAKFDLRVTTGEPLNSCTELGSYQVMVRIYALSSTGAFHAAEFGDLWYRDAKTVLDGAVLDVQELTIQPGETRTLQWQRPPGTRAVGVVANFCRLDEDKGCWMRAIDLGEGSQRLDLHLAGTCLSFVPRP